MQFVYVLNQDGLPLMPTHKLGKVRHLLKDEKAKIVTRSPFTIQLLYDCGNHTQNTTLGVDAGSKHIGISASTKQEELYCSDIELRNDIVKLLATRKENRRTRRNHKTRYRQARFENRVSTKKKGWLAPSIMCKIQSHLQVIKNIHKILPITNIIVEVASFDTQLLKAQEKGLPLPQGSDYQNGEMAGYNTREYVLFRDNHVCQHCHGKSKDKILEVHHLESRKTGGDSPENLLTLCRICHDAYHKDKIKLNQKRGTGYRDAAFMGIMRWSLYHQLVTLYPNVQLTYGYITKSNRIEHGLVKEHYNDAYCIGGHFDATRLATVIYQKKVRCHNRQIHKANLIKGNKKKANQAPYEVHGFRLFDKVKYNGITCFIFGRRGSGYFDIRTLDGTKIQAAISHTKLKLLETRKSYLQEERSRQLLSTV